MDKKKQDTAKEMTKRYFELKEVFGDIHQRVIHPDIGYNVVSGVII